LNGIGTSSHEVKSDEERGNRNEITPNLKAFFSLLEIYVFIIVIFNSTVNIKLLLYDIAFLADKYLPGVVVTCEDSGDVDFFLWKRLCGKVCIGACTDYQIVG
jgi:hypothetical protein